LSRREFELILKSRAARNLAARLVFLSHRHHFFFGPSSFATSSPSAVNSASAGGHVFKVVRIDYVPLAHGNWARTVVLRDPYDTGANSGFSTLLEGAFRSSMMDFSVN